MMPPTRVCDKKVMSYGRRQGLSVGAGQAMTNERVCYLLPKVMFLFIIGHSH